MNLKEIEKVVASIQTHLFRNSNSFSVGMLKSHFRGAGLQFKEHQVYNPGDDVRFIDWKLSAKTNTTFIKTFEEERNIEIYSIIDLSESLLTGYKNVSKLQAAIEITCLLYLLAEKTKDNIIPVIFTDKAQILPVASGRAGITLFISQLEKMGILDEHGKINLAYEFDQAMEEKKKLTLIKSLLARGKEVVFLSDFGATQNLADFNKLFYRRNLHCIKLESPLDNLAKLPYLVFGKKKNEKVLSRQYSMNKQDSLTGRYKSINVADRYLEKFVREML